MNTYVPTTYQANVVVFLCSSIAERVQKRIVAHFTFLLVVPCATLEVLQSSDLFTFHSCVPDRAATLLGADGANWPGRPVRGVSSSAGAGAAVAYDESVSVLAGLWKYSVEFQTSYETGCYTLEYPKKIIIEYHISPKVESKLKIVNMGSVRHRFDEVRHDCNVVLVGDVRVGKSALVNRFIHNKFQEVRGVYF